MGYRRAVGLFRAGRSQEAMRLLQDVIGRAPAAGSPRHLAGVIALSGGDFEAARRHFQSAIRLAGSSAEAAASWVGLGRIEFSVAAPKKALACFQRAEQLSPAFAPALSGEAAAWCDLGNYSRAESCARAALALAGDSSTKLVLARCLLFQSRMDESESLLQELTDAPETSFLARYHLAAIAFSRGRLAEAERGFRAVLKENPRHPGHIELAKAKRFTREDDPDLRTMRRELTSLPRSSDRMDRLLREDLSFALAKAYDDLGLPERAFPLLREANELRTLDDPFNFPAFEHQVESVTALTRRVSEGSANRNKYAGAEPLVIAALPRSGSSLLEQMLGRHSAIRAGGEFSHILP
ncbi:MAG: tetratricopeptide repeat protein, partial [Gammaproteobacteria bacterium]